MKVPSLTTTRTNAPDLTRQYSRQTADPEAFGAGIGRALQQFGAVLTEREDKTDRFGALTALNDFETQMKNHLVEQQRQSSPDGKGFAEGMEQSYDQASSQFVAGLPPKLREEFTYRASQIKQSIIAGALDFQYKAGDAYFRDGVSKIYQKSLSALDPRLGGNPRALEAEKEKIKEAINATDLLPQEKFALWNQMQAGLEGVGYRAAYADAAKMPAGAFEGNIGQIIDSAAARYGQDAMTLRRIAWLESKGKPGAQNPNSTAGGLFQFTNGTAKAYGLRNKNDAAESSDAAARLLRDNRAGLMKALGREPTLGELYLAHQQGLGGATALLSNPDVPAARVVGPKAVVLNGGKPGMTAGQFASMWINKAEGLGTDIDNNPAFANVPYEDRLALRADGIRQGEAEVTEAQKQRKAQYESDLNSLLTGIRGGTVGQSEIDAFEQKNAGMKYEDLAQLDGAFKKYQEDTSLATQGFAKMGAGGTFDPTDTDDKKRVNAMVGDTGLEQITSMDKNYVTTGLLPIVSASGIVPSSVAGTLEGMVRSQNQPRMLFALDTLSQIADANPRAFDRLPDQLQKDVQYWRDRKDLVPQEELMKQLNPGTSMEERQARQTLRKEAQDTLSSRVDGVPALNTLVEEFIGGFQGSSLNPLNWFRESPGIGAIPWAAQGLYKDFQTEYVDAYERYGDPKKASEVATEALKKRWSVTSIGRPTLMRDPPESVYQPYNGSYNWINDQVHVENGFASDFQIISDDTTAEEVKAWKEGKLDRPPSYRIIAIDDKGLPRALPGRQWFKVPDDVRAADSLWKDQRQEASILARRVGELGNIINAAKLGGVQIDPTEQEEYDQLQKRLIELRATIKKNSPQQVAPSGSIARDKKSEGAAKAGSAIGGMFNADN